MTTGIWYTYIVKCADDTLYTGITTDVDRRIAQHNCGKGAKYTMRRAPVVLQYHETHDSRSAASKREYAIKQLSRIEKIKLAATFPPK
tara:strand:- start:189 stop:452 length:264 start_codon:yes stop_codon:yes gene_type:complete